MKHDAPSGLACVQGQEALAVNDLGIALAGSRLPVVADVSFVLQAGEIMGLVGESGSGKTTLGLGLLAHARRGLAITGGRVLIGGHDLLRVAPGDLPAVRRKLVRYVPQDSGTALNPARRIGAQLRECFDEPGEVGTGTLIAMLEEVRLPAKHGLLRAYPHQLSGGQQQRVALAMAFANRPRVVVMDEPTTGLDVSTQAHVLQTVRQLCAEHGVAAVYVSHDLAVVASLARRVAVMYAGSIVEIGPTSHVLHRPSHPYTRALIKAVPDIAQRHRIEGIPGQAPEPNRRPRGCAYAPRCRLVVPACSTAMPDLREHLPGHAVRCLRPDEGAAASAASPPLPSTETPIAAPILEVNGLVARHGTTEILHGISLAIPEHTCVALVGESGSGKTTLARAVGGLHGDMTGTMRFRGGDLPPISRHRSSELRRRVQYVFQNPYASLNPRRSIGQSIAMALHAFESPGRAETRRRVEAVLEQVAFPASAATHYPHELSGGQRQRAAIARALVVAPDLLICDEITSALDVSVQAVIIALLTELQRQQGLSMLFITHNLALVPSIAQSVEVMQAGRIVEGGETRQVLDAPRALETIRLLHDVPRFEPLAADEQS